MLRVLEEKIFFHTENGQWAKMGVSRGQIDGAFFLVGLDGKMNVCAKFQLYANFWPLHS